MAFFQLDDRLATASIALASDDLIAYRLMNDSRFVWLLLIPRQPNITEWSDLSLSDQHRLFTSATQLAELIKADMGADKMNIATIGNLVSQFHLHLIARKIDDALWPDPVWGKPGTTPYEDGPLTQITDRLVTLITSLNAEAKRP